MLPQGAFPYAPQPLASRQRVPEHGQHDCGAGQNGAQRGKGHADLSDFVLGNQVGGQAAEHALQLAGAGGFVIFGAGAGRYALEGCIVNPAPEAAKTTATAAKAAKWVAPTTAGAAHGELAA